MLDHRPARPEGCEKTASLTSVGRHCRGAIMSSVSTTALTTAEASRCCWDTARGRLCRRTDFNPFSEGIIAPASAIRSQDLPDLCGGCGQRFGHVGLTRPVEGGGTREQGWIRWSRGGCEMAPSQGTVLVGRSGCWGGRSSIWSPGFRLSGQAQAWTPACERHGRTLPQNILNRVVPVTGITPLQFYFLVFSPVFPTFLR